MKNTIRTFVHFSSLLFLTGLLSGCVAWPGMTVLLSQLNPVKGSFPVFVMPANASSQPQDRPTLSDDVDGILDPLTGQPPVTPSPVAPELIVVPRVDNVVSESGTTSTVLVRLSQQPTHDVRIRNFLHSLPGEVATVPSEFVFTPGNWNTDQTLTLTGLPDSIQDGDKEVAIDLGTMESLDTRFQGISAGEIRVLNADIDSVGVVVYPLHGLQTTEDGGSDQLTVVLNSKPTHSVTFSVHLSNTSEVASNPSSITFTPANWNAPQTVTLTGLNDDRKDGNQAFYVQLVSATSGDPLYNGMQSSLAHGINLDNDTAGVLVTSSASLPYTTSEDGTTIAFQVKLSSQPTHTVTIPVLSLSPTEGQPNTDSLVFTPVNWNLEQNLVVTGIDDDVVDGDKLYTIRLDKPISEDANYAELHQIDTALTNLDNDFAALVFTNHLNLTTGEDGTNAIFRIRLRSRPTANVTVQIQSSNLAEGLVNPTSITFTPSNWSSNQTIQILGVNDSLIDGDVWYEILFPSVTSSDSHYNGLVVSPLPAINLDDDTPGVMYFNASSITTRENQTGLTQFQVRLKTRPSHEVRFPVIQSSNPEEGIVSPSELVFTPGNWNVPQNISIQPVRDWVVDPDVLYHITFADLESADPLYSGFSVESVPVLNQNSDTLGYVFSPAFTSLNPVVTDSGLKNSFTLRLNSKPTGNVVIPLSSLDTARMVVSPAEIVFTPENWDTPVVIEVEGLFFEQANPPAHSTVAVRVGYWNSSDRKYYPGGSSDYSGFAFGDRNSNTTDNGNFTVRRFNTQRPLSVIHASITSTLTTTELGVEVPLLLRLGRQPTDTVTVQIHSSRPDEGIAVPSILTIQPEEWEDIFTVRVVGQNDDLLDGAQNYQISFTISSVDPYYNGAVAPVVNFRNNDSNTNRLVVSPSNSSTNPLITTRKPGPRNTVTFTLRMNAQPNGTVVFPLTSAGIPSQGVLDKTQLTFNSGNWNVPQTVTITGVDNGSTTTVDYRIQAGPSTSDPTVDPLFHGQSNGIDIHVRNTSPGFVVTDATGPTAEWGRRASLNLRLTSPPTATVTCYYYIDNESEGRGISGTVDASFPHIPQVVRRVTRTTSNWNSHTTITVEGVDDGILDGDQEFHVVFLPCSSPDSDYDGLVPRSVRFVNEDND